MNDLNELEKIKKLNSTLLNAIAGIIVGVVIFIMGLTILSGFNHGAKDEVIIYTFVAKIFYFFNIKGVFLISLIVIGISIIFTAKAIVAKNKFKKSIGIDAFTKYQVNEMMKYPGFVSGLNKDGSKKAGKTFPALLIILTLLGSGLGLFMYLNDYTL